MFNVKFYCKIPILICCVLITTVHGLDDEFCTISTSSGQIRGKQNQTLFDKITYYSFRGIPFAKSPIGELRFKVKNLFRKFVL